MSATQSAASSALAVGDCVSAFGPAASNGAVTAITVRITSTGGSSCTGGAFGGGFGGRGFGGGFGGGPGGPGAVVPKPQSGWGRGGHRRAVLIGGLVVASWRGGERRGVGSVSGGSTGYRTASVTRANIGTTLRSSAMSNR